MKQLNNVIDCYDKTAKDYADKYFSELSYKPFDRSILERFSHDNKSKGAFADLGCGPGQTTKFVRLLGVNDITGIDLSPKIIVSAKKLSPEINFITGNMLELKYTAKFFGGLIAFYSIVHFTYDEIKHFLIEAKRVLKKGGQLLFSFHTEEQTVVMDNFLGKSVSVEFYFFDTDKIIDIINEVDLSIVDAVVRYPYADKEYPSKRAYIIVEKTD